MNRFVACAVLSLTSIASFAQDGRSQAFLLYDEQAGALSGR